MVSAMWGSIPDWVGAIGTAGALFATLWIVRGDRSERVRSQAQKVVVHNTRIFSEEQGNRLEVSFYNGSDQPILNAQIYSDPPNGHKVDEPIVLFEDGMFRPIEPAGTARTTVSFPAYIDVGPIVVFFIDGDGRRWARRVGGGPLLTLSEGMQVARGYDPEWSLNRRAAWRWRAFWRARARRRGQLAMVTPRR